MLYAAGDELIIDYSAPSKDYILFFYNNLYLK